VAVLPIGADHLPYAEAVQAKLKALGIRTILEGEDTINYRVRQCETRKIPTMLIVGGREAEEGTVSVRRYHVGEKKVQPLQECIDQLMADVTNRTLNVTLKTYDDLFFRPAATLSTEAADY
jgi:threonyl-tRNA synthetase